MSEQHNQDVVSGVCFRLVGLGRVIDYTKNSGHSDSKPCVIDYMPYVFFLPP